MTEISQKTMGYFGKSQPGQGTRGAGGFAARYGFFLLVIVVFIIFAILRPTFIAPGNIEGILMSASLGALMFLGLTWLIAAGEIDVSFMSVAALANMVVAALVAMRVGWGTASLAGLAVGVGFGLLNGFLVAILRLPALVITIATGALAASIAAAIGLGTSISLSQTGLVGTFVNGSLGIIPYLTVAVVILYAAGWYAQERLAIGHYIYAMEQNREAVVEAGVPVTLILFLLYIVSGVASAIAGILLAAELSSGQPYLGNSYFIDGLTAVLLGGTALKLGKPNVIGTLVAALFLVGLLNGAALLGWTDSERQIARGVLLLIGVGAVVFAKYKTRGVRR